jgi:Zn-dependent protease/predicted transcriptional regulator
MRYSFTILKIRGIPIEIHFTFLALLGLLFIITAPFIYPVLLFGVIFISVIIHELAHSVVAQRNGISVKKIVIYPIGGAAQIDEIPEKPGIEARIALAGPFTSLFIGMIALGFHFLYPIGFPTVSIFVWTGFLFFDVGVLNIVLAVFNLLPAFPMDGGRVLRAILTYLRKDFVKATEHAAIIGRGFALMMIFIGFLGNIWFSIIGFFIYLGASQEVRLARISAILKPLRVSDVMLDSNQVLKVHPSITLSEAINQMYHSQVQDLVICTDYELVGVITWDEILRIPAAQRLITRVGDLNIKPLAIKSESSVFDAYKVMLQKKARLVPVVHSDAPCNLMGVITNQSISYSLGIGKHLEKSVFLP